MTAVLAAEQVNGIQGEGVISTIKHYSLNCNEVMRHWLDAVSLASSSARAVEQSSVRRRGMTNRERLDGKNGSDALCSDRRK